ncbi:zinc finger protein 845-like isoform X2 [Toxorhynchites rutilus septentrionalis]|uniref:zinc finger protein 845-like isoform X2 n=1 Tax=Toxorhynchites rutilus septentrionalis TaxID=329112 RepID=UPI00247B1B44|nr:zinc finger protein 845-like isoform X2 [Toxorhynchites rutilus septentrionalis]
MSELNFESPNSYSEGKNRSARDRKQSQDIDIRINDDGSKSFICKECDKAFRFKSSCIRHISLMHRAKVYQCEHCDEIFQQSCKYRTHFKQKHPDQHKLECSVCKRRFQLAHHLGRHWTVEHQAIHGPYMKPDVKLLEIKTEISDEAENEATIGSTMESANRHAADGMQDFSIDQIDIKMEFECTSPQLQETEIEEKPDFSKLNQRQDNTITLKEDTSQFEATNDDVGDRVEVKSEQDCADDVPVNTNKQSSDPVGDGLVSQTKIEEKQKHRRSSTASNGNKSLSEKRIRHGCDICEKTFSRPKRLIVHHAVAHGIENAANPLPRYPCDTCGKVFRYWPDFRAHVKWHGDKNLLKKPNRHKCDICEKTFYRPIRLVTHRAVAHGIEDTDNPPPQFRCNICGKAFLYRQTCLTHMKMHSETASNSGRRLSKKPIIKTHSKKHLVSFSCSYRNRLFARKNKLDHHVQIHMLSHEANAHNFENVEASSKSPLEDFESQQKTDGNIECEQGDQNSIKTEFECTSPKVQETATVEKFTQREDSAIPLKEDTSQFEATNDDVGDRVDVESEQNCTNGVPDNTIIQLSVPSYPVGDSLAPQTTIEEKQNHRRSITASNGKKKSSEKLVRPRCDICGKTFLRPRRLNVHRTVVHGIEDAANPLPHLMCDTCGKVFRYKPDLSSHLKCHSDKKLLREPIRHKCDICEKTFGRPTILTVHLAKAHGIEDAAHPLPHFTCDTCGKVFRYKPFLAMHMKWHSTKRKFSCSYCDRSFASEVILNRHIQIHTKDDMLSHEANAHNYENVEASPKSPLEDYESQHRTEGDIECEQGDQNSVKTGFCDICGKTFLRLRRLNVHRTVAHGIEDAANPLPHLMCDTCGKVFRCKPDFSAHLKCHSDKNLLRESIRHKCDICEKTFGRPIILTVHRAEAHGIEDAAHPLPHYTCDTCGKVFRYKPFLVIHMRRHSNKRKFSCSYCNRSFASEVSLNNHIQIHTKVDMLSHEVNAHNSENLETSSKSPLEDYESQERNDGQYDYEQGDQNSIKTEFECTSPQVQETTTAEISTREEESISAVSLIPQAIPLKEDTIQFEATNDNVCTNGVPVNSNTQSSIPSYPVEDRSAPKSEIEEKQKHRRSLTASNDNKNLSEKSTRFGCDICEKKFCRPIILTVHRAEAHGIEDPVRPLPHFTCDTCGKVFRYKPFFSMHVKMHSTKHNFSCSYCDRSFASEVDLRHHIQIHTKDGMLSNEANVHNSENMNGVPVNTNTQLPIPSYPEGNGLALQTKMGEKKNYRRNSTARKGNRYVPRKPVRTSCDICEKTFLRPMRLAVHRAIVHEIEDVDNPLPRLTCDTCGKVFRSQLDLTWHTKKHEEPVKDTIMYNCDICEKSFFRPIRLNVHRAVAHGIDDAANPLPHLKCAICGKVFRYKPYLATHMKKHLERASNSDKNLSNKSNKCKCDICEKTFYRPILLVIHRALKHGIEDAANPLPHLTCAICSKVFRHKIHLLPHMKRHKGERNLSCSHCNRLFSKKSDLDRHELTHTTDFKHKCRVCGYGSSVKNIVLSHEARVHNYKDAETLAVSLPCTICGKVFFSTHRFKAHEAEHRNERNIKCELCDRKFNSRMYMRAHLLTKHLTKTDGRQVSKKS